MLLLIYFRHTTYLVGLAVRKAFNSICHFIIWSC